MCISWIRAVVRDGHDQARIGDRLDLAAVAAGERRGGDAHAARRLQRRDDVGRLAGGGDADGEVAAPADRLDLPREKLLEAEIVADRGERRRVGGQRDRGDRRAVLDVADGQLGREVLRIGGAAAIAEEQDLAAALEAGDGGRDELAEFAGQRLARVAQDRFVLVELAGEELVEIEPCHEMGSAGGQRRARRKSATTRSRRPANRAVIASISKVFAA